MSFIEKNNKLQKKYSISEVHAGCFLSNFGDKNLCSKTCHNYDKCKQMQGQELKKG